MKRNLIFVTAFAFLCSSDSIAKADPIYVTPVGVPLSGVGHDKIRFRMEVTKESSLGDFAMPLFDQVITASDAGKTFTVSSSSPFFSHNIGLLTDGFNDHVAISGDGMNRGFGGFYPEIEFFSWGGEPARWGGRGSPADMRGVDRVTLHVDALHLFVGSPDAPGADDGDNMELTMSFFDDVRDTPEPTSVCLALLGGLGVFVWRNRKRTTVRTFSPAELGIQT